VLTSLHDSEFVRVDLDEAGVATLRLDRPPLNALSRGVQSQIGAAAEAIAFNSAVRVVILTGGDQVFAAGADIKEMSEWDAQEATRQVGPMHSAFDAVASIPVPVIAAIAGFALGGGCELAMCADIRIASDSAVLGQPEVNLGIIPGAGGTQRLTRLVGPARAKDLIFTGRRITAAEALSIGLVDRVVDQAQLMAEVLSLAQSLASGPTSALRAAKQAIDAGLDQDLSEALAMERRAFSALFGAPEQREGFGAFLAKRPAEFRGLTPQVTDE
jgi:enoyl-CoA hydratase/carnithine racemase